MEKEHYEKLAKRQEHANAVRKRKSLGGENIILAWFANSVPPLSLSPLSLSLPL